MPRHCTVCTHSESAAIDHALIGGEAFRRIAAQFSVSEASVRRHKADHLPAHLKHAQEAETVTQADSLLAKVAAIEAEAKRIARKAEKKGDLRVVMSGLRELARLVELLAKLKGELQQTTTVNLLITPEWHALRTTIMAALAPFPEARRAIAEALQNGNSHV